MEDRGRQRKTKGLKAEHVILTVAVALWVGTACAGQSPRNERAIKEVESGKRKVARASWWGYNPDDATQSLQAAINSGAKKVIVENMGKPWVVDMIQLVSDQEVIFEKGVVVLAKRGAFRGKGDSLFTASLKRNVTLRGYGATLKMWKQDYASKEYEKAEWRMVLKILSCSNVRVEGLTLASSGGDGIYLGVAKRGVTNTNVTIKDVTCVDNYRQGISVISAENLLIENCVLKDTSGTPPQAGIDFEPNESSEKLVNCVMRNCVSENNRGGGYLFHLTGLTSESADVSIRLENCRSRGGPFGVSVTTGNSKRQAVKGTIEFVNCEFEGSAQSGIIVRSKPVDGCRLRFVKCQVNNAALEQPTQSPITLVSSRDDAENVGGIEFVQCTVRDPVERLPLSYLDLSTRGLQLTNVSGTIAVERKKKRTVYKLDEKLIGIWFPRKAYRYIPRFETKGVRYEPVNPAAKPESFRRCSARQRVHAEYLLWAEAGQQVSFTVLIQPVGSGTPASVPVRIVSPSGTETTLPNTQGVKETPYSFIAEETGAYKVICEPGSNTAQVNSTSHRVCLYSEDASFHMLSTEGDYFFWVPPGVREFGINVSGDNPAERVKAALYAPAGTKVEEKDDIAQPHQFAVRRQDFSKGEVWSLRLGRPSHGVLEDYYVQLLGIPPLLAHTPEALLRPSM